MAATLDQILQQEQLHFQVIAQRIDNLYTNLNSSIVSQDQRVINTLTQITQNAQNQARGDANIIVGKINELPNFITNAVRNPILARLDAIRADFFGKLDVVSNNILNEVDKKESVITSNLTNATKTITDKVDGDTRLVEFKVDGALTANLNKIDTIYKLIVERTGSVTNTLNNAIQTKVSEAEALIKSSVDRLNQSIHDASNASNNPIVNVQTPTTPPSQNGTDFLTQLIAFLSGATNVGAQDNQGNTVPLDRPHLIYSAGSVIVAEGGILGSLNQIGEALSNQLQQISTIIAKASKGDYTTLDQFELDFKRLGVNTDLISGVLQLLFIVPSLLNIGKQATDVFNLRIQRLNAEKYDLTQVDVSATVDLFRRKQIDQTEALSKIRALGFSDKDSNSLTTLAHSLFNENLLLRGVYRGAYTDEFARKLFEKLGFDADQWLAFSKINQPRPGINDLIQFAVKEVYSPETSSKFGQYEEFPADFARYAGQEGLNSEYAKQYWAAHWQLPGAQQGFDMFHRGIISETELKALLKALDVMPYWRDKLIGLNYNILTRVDTRRLHAHDIISDKELLDIYKKEGYKEDDAQKLLRLAKAIEDDQENPKKKKLKDLTYTVIINAYGDGLLSRQDAINQIKPLGYSDEEINLLLKIEDYNNANSKSSKNKEKHNAQLSNIATKSYLNRAISREDLLSYLVQAGFNNTDAQSEANFIDAEYAISFKSQIAKEVERQYFEGLYSDSDVIVSLQSLGFLPTEAQQILSELQTLKTFRTKKPTISQFTSLYKKDYYTKDEYVKILQDEGYAEEFIPAMLELAHKTEEQV